MSQQRPPAKPECPLPAQPPTFVGKVSESSGDGEDLAGNGDRWWSSPPSASVWGWACPIQQCSIWEYWVQEEECQNICQQ